MQSELGLSDMYATDALLKKSTILDYPYQKLKF